ncbi:hypothetical protein PV326_011520, partial [Microctonus aethiopoides]
MDVNVGRSENRNKNYIGELLTIVITIGELECFVCERYAAVVAVGFLFAKGTRESPVERAATRAPTLREDTTIRGHLKIYPGRVYNRGKGGKK